MSGLMTGRGQPRLSKQLGAIAPSLMRVVENVLSVAWRKLLDKVSDGLFSICDADEDAITTRLYDILCEMYAADPEQVRGYSSFETPIREGNVSNHDGSHPDRQPDLAFRPLRGRIPTTNSAHAAIFIECKPIDSHHPVPGVYCRKGLVRFIQGDYAWAVDRAMMVAYVKNRCRLPEGLSPCIQGNRASGEYGFQGTIVATSPTNHGDAVYQTVHPRNFPLAGHPAGPITLHHLWLRPIEACEDTKCQGMRASTPS